MTNASRISPKAGPRHSGRGLNICPISRIRLGHIDVIRHPRFGPRASMLIPSSLEPSYMFREGSRFGRPSFAVSRNLYVLRACTYATQLLFSHLTGTPFRTKHT